jgi:hypothetical protein
MYNTKLVAECYLYIKPIRLDLFGLELLAFYPHCFFFQFLLKSEPAGEVTEKTN